MRAHLDIKHEGTLSDERTRMSFDQNSIAHLMSVLTDLYSNPTLAVIREYSTNAYDAHRAAGHTDPIEITLPSQLAPTFTVRDHGTGMSVDEIVNNFSKYGWSSKRDNDEEVGMLGLGCKSALTYTSQFTMISIYNGVRAVVLVTREEDGAGALQIIDTSATDEPNGVEVQVPIKSVSNFCQEAADFFAFWEEGSVLINGAPPMKRHGTAEDDLVLDDSIVLTSPSSLDQDYFVMGNVPYPLTSYAHGGKLAGDYQTRSAVVRVPIGSINFTPSREALHYTKRTLDTIATAREYITASVARKADNEVNDAPTHMDALTVATRWRSAFGHRGKKFTYWGHDVPNHFSVPDQVMRWSLTMGASTPCVRAKSISIRESQEAIFVTHHGSSAVSAQTKKRVLLWMKQNDLDTSENCVAFFTNDPIGLPWLADRPRVSYHLLKLIELDEPKPTVVGGTVKGLYRIVDHFGDIRTTQTLQSVVFWHGAWDKAVSRTELVRYIEQEQAPNKVNVVILGTHQVKKFERDHPHATPARDYIETQMQAFVGRLTPDQAFHLGKTSVLHESRILVLAERIHEVYDPELRHLVATAAMSSRVATAAWSILSSLCVKFDIPLPDLPKSNLEARIKAISKKYPLLKEAPASKYDWQWRGGQLGDYIAYVNAMYEMNYYFQPETQGATIYR